MRNIRDELSNIAVANTKYVQFEIICGIQGLSVRDRMAMRKQTDKGKSLRKREKRKYEIDVSAEKTGTKAGKVALKKENK